MKSEEPAEERKDEVKGSEVTMVSDFCRSQYISNVCKLVESMLSILRSWFKQVYFLARSFYVHCRLSIGT